MTLRLVAAQLWRIRWHLPRLGILSATREAPTAPPILRKGLALDRLMEFCGVMAFSGAVHARSNSMLVVMMGWGVAVIGVMLVMGLFDEVALESVVTLWFPIVGLVGVPAAFLLNYRTITRGMSSSAVYRPPPGAALYRGSRP